MGSFCWQVNSPDVAHTCILQPGSDSDGRPVELSIRGLSHAPGNGATGDGSGSWAPHNRGTPVASWAVPERCGPVGGHPFFAVAYRHEDVITGRLIQPSCRQPRPCA